MSPGDARHPAGQAAPSRGAAALGQRQTFRNSPLTCGRWRHGHSAFQALLFCLVLLAVSWMASQKQRGGCKSERQTDGQTVTTATVDAQTGHLAVLQHLNTETDDGHTQPKATVSRSQDP